MISTGYSFRHAVGSLAEVISRIKEIGWSEAPVADRLSTFSFVKWDRMTKEAGLRPVYGVSLGVVPERGVKKPIVDWWKFFAKDSLEPLHDLLYRATSREGDSWVTYEEMMTGGFDGLIAITGSRVLLDNISVHEDLYVAMSPATPKGLWVEAKDRGHRFVAISDNCYPRRDDERMYLAALGWRSSTQTYPRHIMGDAELREAIWYCGYEDFSVAVKNRQKILTRCRAEMKKAALLRPPQEKTLREMCVEGAKRRGCDLSDPVYAERLEKELRIIDEKNFADYFFVVADILQWARQHMICGPGRGSSSGSLVCWLLEITAVDPIKFDLVFERFIDITRADYPDIDVDLSDERRELVFGYLREKYGREKVARLATVILFQSKSALNQIGAAIGVPKWMVEETVNSVITRSKGDSRADYKVMDTFTMTSAGQKLAAEYPEIAIAGRIEGHPVTSSQHAAGVVLTNEPVRKYVGVRGHDDLAMVDWQDAKDIDLIKIDILGLTQLSTFERCLEMVGIREPGKFLEELPLDDPGALDVLNQRKMSGVFQFQGATTKQVVHQLDRITEFEDIVSITALCRPGPLGSGGTQSWVNRKNGVEKVEVFHEAFLPYLEKTMGVMVYQEQVMRICREIGGMSWGDVTALRKAMGKSLGMEYFDSYRDKYLPGAIAKGVPEEAAMKMWDGMCSFGMYGFNRAHAVAYGLLTYWCCWLKAHHPVEFAAATLDAEHEPNKQVEILRELKGEGVDYRAVDPEVSTDRWTVKTEGNRKVLVGPLTLVKGVGPAMMQKVVAARSGGAPLTEKMKERLSKLTTSIDSLYPVSDATAKLWPKLLEEGKVTKPLEEAMKHVVDVSKVYDERRGQSAMVIGVLVRNHPLNENEPGRVARRGYAIKKGPLQALNFHLRDDTGEIFCKLSRHQYSKFGERLIAGRPGKSLFVIMGKIPPDFRMLWVNDVKYLGEIDGEERHRGDEDESRPDRSVHQEHLREDPQAVPVQG